MVKEATGFGGDLELAPVYICIVCGHTVEGNVLNLYPIFKAKRDKFRFFLA